MNKRNQTIWMLLLILSGLFLVLNGFRLYPIQKKYFSTVTRVQKTNFGADKQLENVIEYLENRLEKRSQYQFSLDTEPFNLQNVLFMYDSQGRMVRFQEKGKIRVTAIFIGGSKPQALINYNNINHIIAIGDSIAGGEILWIDKEEVVFSKDNKEIHYPVTLTTDISEMPK